MIGRGLEGIRELGHSVLWNNLHSSHAIVSSSVSDLVHVAMHQHRCHPRTCFCCYSPPTSITFSFLEQWTLLLSNGSNLLGCLLLHLFVILLPVTHYRVPTSLLGESYLATWQEWCKKEKKTKHMNCRKEFIEFMITIRSKNNNKDHFFVTSSTVVLCSYIWLTRGNWLTLVERNFPH